MKVTLYEGEDAVDLAPGGVASPDPSFAVQPQSKSGMRYLIGADFGQPDDRKGVTQIVPFAVSRQHETITACELFFMLHPQAATGRGLVTFTLNDGVTKLYMWANVVTTGVNYEGLTSNHSYNISGGQLSATREDVLPDDYE